MGGVAGGAGAAFDIGEDAADAAGASCGLSFSPQTTVLMADGSSKPIDKLRVGDLVEAYDPATGKTGPHRVTAVMVNRDPATEHLVLDTGALETTPNHPFYTTDRGWVEAGQLKIGEHIRTATGTDALVVSFTVDPHPARMWDITVAGAHSFFVGSGEVLVHNCDLFHGTDLASAENIAANGISRFEASALGGGDMFWMTASRESAGWFAEANVAGGAPAVLGISFEGGLPAAMARGVVTPVAGMPGVFTTTNWAAFNRIATFTILR